MKRSPIWKSPRLDGRIPSSRSHIRPRVEVLEARLAPATYSWTGFGATPFWADGGNWAGLESPRGDPAGAILIFPPGAAQLTSIDNIDPTELHVARLQITGDGYSFQGSFPDGGQPGNILDLLGPGGPPGLFPAISVVGGGGSTTFEASLSVALRSYFSDYVVQAVGTLTINGVISGGKSGGALRLTGGGTVVFGGTAANTYAPATQVGGASNTSEGATLVLSKPAGVNAVPGDLTIGASYSTASSVRLLADDQIPDDAAVTIGTINAPDPFNLLDLNGHSETIGPLSMTGNAQLTTGTGTLTLGGDVATTFFQPVGPGGDVPVINGNLSLGTATRTFTVGRTGGPPSPSTPPEDALLAGVISGAPGVGLTLNGGGTLQLGGTAANTYTGTTTVNSGTLLLGKTPGVVAVAGPLRVGNGENSGVVRLTAAGQLGGGAAVTLTGSGLLDLHGFTGAVGSLAGAGTVALGAGTLSVGGDNTSTSFDGLIGGSGGLNKMGTGTLTLSRDNTYSGPTTVSAGTLLVNGTQPASAVTVTGGTLGGAGTVGAVTASGGVASPGSSPGTLRTGSLTLGPGSSFRVELDGPAAGTGFDTLTVTGGVTLGGGLSASLGFAPALGTTFLLIDNDGGDAVSGTFAGLPEGTVFAVGDALFQISYAGGTGNDVVLTRRDRPVPAPPGPDPTPQPQPGPAAVRDVTTLVGLTRGKPQFHGSGRARLTLTLRNPGGQALAGPLTLVVDGLGKRVRLQRRTGITQAQAPAGSPFVDLNPGGDGVLGPGEAVTVTLDFSNLPGRRLAFRLRLLAGVGPR